MIKNIFILFGVALWNLAYCTGIVNDYHLLLFNEKYSHHVLAPGGRDAVEELSRYAVLVPFEVENIDSLALNLHIDSEGHGVLKDITNSFRSKVSTGSLSFTQEKHMESNMWFKYVEKTENKENNKMLIVSNNKCLTASENKKGEQRLSFEQCTGATSQVWGTVLKDEILNTINGTDEDLTIEKEQLKNTLDKLDGYTMKHIFT